jgi:hypothetical protein
VDDLVRLHNSGGDAGGSIISTLLYRILILSQCLSSKAFGIALCLVIILIPLIHGGR